MTTLINEFGKSARTPQGFKVKGQSYQALEEIAAGVRVLFARAGVLATDQSIDCIKLLEDACPRHFKVDYKIEDDAVMGNCAGFFVPRDNIIVLSDSVYSGLYTGNNFSRSTVVHEFAHFALDHGATFNRGASVGEHGFFEDSEWQAKALTAAIMMPLDLCQAFVHAPSALAMQCQVSEAAATYRISRLLKDKKISPQGVLGAF